MGVEGPGSSKYPIIVPGANEFFTVADTITYVGDITEDEVVFIDNNNIGDSIEPTELLYIGGESITANTIT